MIKRILSLFFSLLLLMSVSLSIAELSEEEGSAEEEKKNHKEESKS